MRALVTNDDGIDSQGLFTLAALARAADLEVVVAAPHKERSGSSASLSALRTDGRLIVQEERLESLEDVPSWAVEATPALIVWAAARGAFGERPDLVLSGINKGPNTGHAILHSGTVGAALTAEAHGLSALAVSVSSPEPSHWDTASDVASRALAWLLKQPGNGPTVLNLNVPNVSLEDLRGLRAAPLASFGAVQADIAETGEGCVTVTFSEIDVSSEPDTDAGLQISGPSD